MIWLGAMLRKKILFFRGLVPSSLIGGAIGLLLITNDFAFGQKSENFVNFAFHFFTLSFMSLALAGSSPRAIDRMDEPRKRIGALWLSVGWTTSLAIQALVGLTCITIYNQLSDQTLSQSLGMLVTHGFTQGPGQAIAMASIWENQFAIDNAVNFGLVYASVGFICAFIVGFPCKASSQKR